MQGDNALRYYSALGESDGPTGPYQNLFNKGKSRKGKTSKRFCILFICLLFGSIVALALFGIFGYSGAGPRGWNTGRPFPPDVLRDMDLTADPCTDFYNFSCGGFEARAKGTLKPYEDERTRSWGPAQSRVQRRLKEVLEGGAGRAEDFYHSCINVSRIAKDGAAPLAPWLRRIDAVTNLSGLAAAVAELQRIEVVVFFDWDVIPDPENPTHNVLELLQGGLSLPAAYYAPPPTNASADANSPVSHFPRSPTAATAGAGHGGGAHAGRGLGRGGGGPGPARAGAASLEALGAAMRRSFELQGLDPAAAAAAAQRAMGLEARLAAHHAPPAAQRTSSPLPVTLAGLSGGGGDGGGDGGLDLEAVFRDMGLKGVEGKAWRAVSREADYFAGLARVLRSSDPLDWQAYLRFRTGFTLGADLSDSFLDIGLSLEHAETGVTRRMPRWKKCVAATAAAVPDDVAQLYVKRFLPEAARQAALDMMARIRDTFAADLHGDRSPLGGGGGGSGEGRVDPGAGGGSFSDDSLSGDDGDAATGGGAGGGDDGTSPAWGPSGGGGGLLGGLGDGGGILGGSGGKDGVGGGSVGEEAPSAAAGGAWGVEWLGPAARREALEKLAAMRFVVGRPARWEPYPGLSFPPAQSFAAHSAAASAAKVARALARLAAPVDRGRWGVADPTAVDAWYSQAANVVFVPAGILQDPFFAPDRHPAQNYGSLGGILGHEMTHGFDDEGRKYDARCRLRSWWGALDVASFRRRAACIRRLYSGFRVGGRHVDGALTLGENIADMGGAKLALAAFESLQRQTDPGGPGGGSGGDGDQGGAPGGAAAAAGGLQWGRQLLLVSWGQVWCGVERPAAVRLGLREDPHSPNPIRVNGPLSQLPAFAAAFACPAGAPMNPPARCALW